MASFEATDSDDKTPQPIVLHPSEVPKDLICSICYCVPLDPVTTPVCEHMFCRGCLQLSVIQNEKVCPMDRLPCTLKDTEMKLTEGSFIHRVWSAVQIQCEFTKSRGCTWTGSIADYTKHGKTDCVCAGEVKPLFRTPEERWNLMIRQTPYMNFDEMDYYLLGLMKKVWLNPCEESEESDTNETNNNSS